MASGRCSFAIKLGLQGFYFGEKNPTGSLIIGNETK